MHAGGNTLPAIRRAAQVGDAWSPYGIGLENFKAGVASLRSLGQGRPCPLVAAHMMLHIAAPGESTTSAAAQRAHIAGSPEEVAGMLEQYRQAGLAYMICGFEADDMDGFLRQMRVFAGQVAPRFVDSA